MNAAMDPLLVHRQENTMSFAGGSSSSDHVSLHHQQAYHVAAALNDARADLLVDGGGASSLCDDAPKGKRLCRFPGCTRVIKSQGHCQRHGAKTKRCRIDGCEKQAQGTHDGMCKRHWKSINCPEEQPVSEQPPPPEGESVYDTILPASIAFRPVNMRIRPVAPQQQHQQLHGETMTAPTDASIIWEGNIDALDLAAAAPRTSKAAARNDPLDPLHPPPGTCVMPLITFLRHERHREAGWHRNAERRARGMFLVSNLSQQLEPWERQLALVETLMLSGGTPYANFKDLAHAWGRDKGFHTALAQSVCERRGEVDRKRRSDAGSKLSDEAKASFRKKLRARRGGENIRDGNDGDAINHQDASLYADAYPVDVSNQRHGETTAMTTRHHQRHHHDLLMNYAQNGAVAL
ncbi:hypothetical protein MPSEU_001103000 [Mayamaea pseudoterrestris]|nr:hypothetical protein MPSEU_001103000 [Mayamaea pseudoterrestris]